MNTKIFILITIISMVVQSGKKNQVQNQDTNTVRPKSTVNLQAKKMPNHISRQKLVINQNLVRNVKRHKMVLQELVEENNFEIIAEKKSKFLNKSLGFSKGFKMFTNFAQLIVQIRKQGVSYDLNQTLQETLTKFLTLANRSSISKRGQKFFYLLEYKSLKSFLVDLREKKANLENQCKFGRQKNQIQCQYNLYEAYEQLFLYFNDLDIASVTSPEFKDKFEEQIDSKYISKLNSKEIEKIIQQYQKNIINQSDKNIEKLKKMINDMFQRKNNVISNVHESRLVKEKILDKIIQFLNNKIYIRKSKDQLLNFYSYHFITSMDYLLAPVFIADKNQQLPSLVAPYKCYIYEKTKVDDFLKDLQALQDYLRQQNDKTFKAFRQNLKKLRDILENLDNNYSENFVLEQLKDVNKKFQVLKAKTGKRTTKNLDIKSGKPLIRKKKIDNQKLPIKIKRNILEHIIGFHTKVPKSRLVKRTLFFRKNYDQSKINKQRSCEKSFYHFLEAAANMFIGSESLDYRGDEIRIFGYVYRYDFYNKLYQKMRLLQDCLKKQPMTKSNQEVKLTYQKVIERYNQILRLNHDYVELEIQFNIDAIRKKLNGGKDPESDFISDDEKNKIELYKNNLRKNFYKQRGIVEEPSNKIQPDLIETYQSQNESSIRLQSYKPQENPFIVQLDKSSSESQEANKNIIENVKHKNKQLSFESDTDSFEISEEQMNKEIEDFNKEVQKYQKMKINSQLQTDSSQSSEEQLELLEENSYQDTSDEQDYIKDLINLQNLQKSKMLQVLIQINEIDLQDKIWNEYQTYKRAIYYLIESINLINQQVEDNSFNEGKRGTWIVLKYPKELFDFYISSLKNYTQVLNKFYTIEADQFKIILNSLITYINQDLHLTKEFYYERYFIANENNQDESEEDNIDLSNIPDYNNKLNIDKIKISKLYPILVQIILNINKKFIEKAKNNEDPTDLQNNIDKFINSLNDILNDDNLILKSKFNQRQNRYINYGIFKYSTIKFQKLKDDIDDLKNILDNSDDQTDLDLLNDFNDLIIFFNGLKNTRAYLYELTNAEFDNNMVFIKYDSEQQLLSIEDNESSESTKKNLEQQDPRYKHGSFTDSSQEEYSDNQKSIQNGQSSYQSNESSLEQQKQITKQKGLKKQYSIENSSNQSQEFDYEINSQQDSTIQEETSEEKYQENFMNLDKIQQSQIYKPLLNIQNSLIEDYDYLQIFNNMVFQFNLMTNSEDLVQTAIRIIKKQKIKIGTYHYPHDQAQQFLQLISNLDIYLNLKDGHDLLKDDLQLIIKTFKIFRETRNYYHEPFSAVLIDDYENEISKPLLDFNLDNLNLDDFSLLSDQDNFQNNKNIIQSNRSSINDDNISLSSSDPLKYFQTTIKKINTNNEPIHKNINIKSHPVSLSLEESSLEEELNQKNKTKQSDEQIEQINIIKRKRKIYVIEILECEDCIENNYVQLDDQIQIIQNILIFINTNNFFDFFSTYRTFTSRHQHFFNTNFTQSIMSAWQQQ